MTETSPLATVGAPLAKHDGLSASELVDIQVKQGRQIFGIDLKSSAATGATLPHDGVSVGELKVRGNWVISGYFKGEGGAGRRQRRVARHRRRRRRSTPTVLCSSPTA